MIRQLRAFAWLRWHLLVNTFRGGRKRDTLEQISRALQLMVPVILVTLSLGSVLATMVLGFFAGRSLGQGLLGPAPVLLAFRVALVVITAIVAFFAVSSPVQSSLTKYTRLLLLPISRRMLHLTEVGASLFDPWIVLIVPGLAAFAVGLAAGGMGTTGGLAAVAGLLFVAVLACLSATVGFLVAWLFRSRRRAEMLTLLIVLAISFASVLPALLAHRLDRRDGPARREGRNRQTTMADVDRVFARVAWLPSELYAGAVRAGVDGRARDAVWPLAGLGIQVLLLFAASSVVHGRLVGSVEGRGSRRHRVAPGVLRPRVPLASPATSAVAAAQFRSGLRSVRGRLVVILPGPLIAILLIAFRAVPDEMPWVAEIARRGHLLFAAGAVFAVYALQPFTMNLFATDRAGLTLQFLSPASDVEIARGKAAGVGLMATVAVALCFGVSIVMAPGGSALLWVAAGLAGLATFLWLSPLMIVLSALFPVAVDLSRAGSGGNPHPIAMLGGAVGAAVTAAPAAGILVLTDIWLRQPGTGLALMAAWTGLAWLAARPLTAIASRTLGRRRENLALVAANR
ncbi:MAG: hypothetical protein R2752_08435 [Vicinamibacterales bacterium]